MRTNVGEQKKGGVQRKFFQKRFTTIGRMEAVVGMGKGLPVGD